MHNSSVEKSNAGKNRDSAQPNTGHAAFGITGMHCPSCAMLIESSLRDAAGVASASVDFKASRAVAEYDSSKTDSAKLAKLVRDMGYTVSIQ